MSSGSGGVRGLVRRVADRVAKRVATDELFEKKGERAPTPPLPPRSTSAPPPAPVATPTPAPAAASAATAAPARTAAQKAPATRAATGASLDLPTRGCVRGGVELVKRAHGPGPRRRVVNHWATWCVPCVDELPLLIDLASRYRDRADFLGVSWDLFDPRGEDDDIVEHVERFADGNGVTWPSVLVTASPESFFTALALTNRQVPQTWVIDTDGAVLGRFDGVLTEDSVAKIARLLEAG